MNLLPPVVDIASCVFAMAALLSGFYIKYVIRVWMGDFADGSRVKRTDKKSPSNKQLPGITDFDDLKSRISGCVEKHGTDFGFKHEFTDNNIDGRRRNRRESPVLRERKRALPFNGVLESDEKAEELDMDHVYIEFMDFLWAYIFVMPMTYVLYLKGIWILKLRVYLKKIGFLKVEVPDIKSLIGMLCLEQSQVINYFARTKKKGTETGNNNIAVFCFPDFACVDDDCEFRIADLFAVYIDLDTKRFVKAELDDKNLTPMETFILLTFNTVSAQHVKLHAVANWGINDANPFLRRSNIVTAVYNYLGYTNFVKNLERWERDGLLSKGWSEKRLITKIFDHGVREGIGPHGHITELMRHSRLVNFTVRVRIIFFHEFARHKHMFPGIDGEALFVGTVLHSLDHKLLEWNVPDPLWLDVGGGVGTKFGKMAELTRLVRACFVEDLPFVHFPRRFRGSGHPFFERVYRKAAKIDRELADNMDICIIK